MYFLHTTHKGTFLTRYIRNGATVLSTHAGSTPPIDWITVNTKESSRNAAAASQACHAPQSKALERVRVRIRVRVRVSLELRQWQHVPLFVEAQRGCRVHRLRQPGLARIGPVEGVLGPVQVVPTQPEERLVPPLDRTLDRCGLSFTNVALEPAADLCGEQRGRHTDDTARLARDTTFGLQTDTDTDLLTRG